MKKVKIFTRGTSDEFDKLEMDMNKWLEENPKISIVETILSTSSCTRAAIHSNELVDAQGLVHYINCTTMIIYENK